METNYTYQDFVDEYEETPVEQKTKKVIPNDAVLADRWLSYNRQTTAYGESEYRRYNPKTGLWKPIAEEMILKEIKAIIWKAQSEGVKPTSRLLNSIKELIRVEIFVEKERWNIPHDVIVCKNGILHIPTRTLLDHTYTIYATTGLNYNYDPAATCPAFMQVLETIKEAADFFQEFAGYALTPDTSHEIATWLKGPKGSGKSTAVIGLQAMLGSRAGLLGLADIERSRFALTQLPGKTLVISTEQPDTFIRASYILNAIISGEEIKVERKFRDEINITPTAKILWAMNQLPRVADPDDGIMRRVKIIEFPELPESKRDPAVKETVKTEGAGILNWALDGLDRIKKRGKFSPPACVINATREFQEKNDVPALFLEDVNAIYGPTKRIQAQVLYNKYKTWCIDNGHKPLSSTKAADEWARLGFTRNAINGRRYWEGLEIP